MDVTHISPVAVLVVEDEISISEVLRLVLEDEGYLVYDAADGMSALACLRTSPQHLVVLLDWMLPKLDGVQVLATLVADGAVLRKHAYILMTAASPANARQLLHRHVPEDVPVTILTKPFNVDTLLVLVKTAAAALMEMASASIKQTRG